MGSLAWRFIQLGNGKLKIFIKIIFKGQLKMIMNALNKYFEGGVGGQNVELT